MALPRRAPINAPERMDIRPATVQDIPEIVAIWGELADYHARLDSAFAPSASWHEEYRQFIRTLLGRDDALAVVATDGDQLVGYAVGRISLLPAFFERRRRGYIHDAVTRQGYRRRGIGARLVEALLDWMRSADVSMVELTVATGNEDAVRFWKRLGFGTYMQHMKREIL